MPSWLERKDKASVHFKVCKAQKFINVGDWHFGSAVSLILAILVIILMGLINRVEKYAGYQEENKRKKTKKV